MTFLTEEQIADVQRIMAEYAYFKKHIAEFDAPFGLRARNAYDQHKPIDAIEWTESGSHYTAEFSVFKTDNYMSFVPVLTRDDDDVNPAIIRGSLIRMATTMGLLDKTAN